MCWLIRRNRMPGQPSKRNMKKNISSPIASQQAKTLMVISFLQRRINYNYNCNCIKKLFRIKHITLLEGETFLRNKHEIAFFEIKCTFFGRKENTIRVNKPAMKKFFEKFVI